MNNSYVYYKHDEMSLLDAKTLKTNLPTAMNPGKFTFYNDDDSESRIFLRFADVAAILPGGSGDSGFRIRLRGKATPILVRAANYRVDLDEYLVFVDASGKRIPDIYVDLSEVLVIYPVG